MVRKKKIDWIYWNKLINYSFIYIFLFLWTFNIVLVGFTYQNYRYQVEPEDEYSKSFQVQSNNKGPEFIPTVYSTPAEWDKYKKVSQSEIEELESYYNRILWLSVFCLTGLVLSSPSFKPKIQMLRKMIDKLE